MAALLFSAYFLDRMQVVHGLLPCNDVRRALSSCGSLGRRRRIFRLASGGKPCLTRAHAHSGGPASMTAASTATVTAVDAPTSFNAEANNTSESALRMIPPGARDES
jgi:hypothetical protein